MKTKRLAKLWFKKKKSSLIIILANKIVDNSTNKFILIIVSSRCLFYYPFLKNQRLVFLPTLVARFWRKQMTCLFKKKNVAIVIKLNSGIDPTTELSPWLYMLTQVNPNQPKKNKKKIKVLIFHMKKLRNNPCEYRLYML